MNKFKRLISFTLTFALIALTGCSAGSVQTGQSSKLKIVASDFPAYDFARAVAGDNAEITMLLPPGSESHSFDPTPQNIIAIEECDVFIYNGGESESWVADILNSASKSNQSRVAMMDCVETLEEEFTEGMQGHHEHKDSEHDHDEKEYDEHVWTSPLNAKKIVSQISKTLCDIDPENAKAYKQNADEYCVKLDELDNEFKEIVKASKRKTLVFGDRMPFRYFLDEYGLEAVAAFPGCASETEPSAATVAFLIDKVKQEDIPVVLHLELSNEKLVDTICQDTGKKSMLLHSCHNVTKDDFHSGKTYIDLMRENCNTLREALN